MVTADRINRTWLCNVVFTDIVGYSKQSTRTQHAIKEVFNHYLGEALKQSSPEDLVILDTGDGAAVCFSDPEEALFSSLAMQSAFATDKSIPNYKLEVRIGINLGPVKLIKDLNGKINAVGDGINDAQRVMAFAGANQILVSRAFFEVARSLSEEYHGLFAYEGTRTDKHVREHSVYSLATPGSVGSASVNPLVETITVAAKAVPTPAGWPKELLAQVEAELTKTLGPITRVLVKTTAREFSDWDGFCGGLASHLHSDKEKREFLARCEKLRP